MIGIRRLAAASVVACSVTLAAPPSSGQVIVFDPNNYSQNVLTAARELQQIKRASAAISRPLRMR